MTSTATAVTVPLAVRHWPGRQQPERVAGGVSAAPVRDRDTRLVFDTETRTALGQELMVGCWRLYVAGSLVEEGLFHPDELPATDPASYRVILDYAAGHRSAVPAGYVQHGSTSRRLLLLPLSEWLTTRLLRYGYKGRAAVVGHNLPFDLSRLAADWTPSRGASLGGFTLRLWGRRADDGRWHRSRYRPDLRIRPLGDGQAVSWAPVQRNEDGQYEDGRRWQGRFVDTAKVSAALTGLGRGRLSLEAACAAFDVPFAKAPVCYGELSPTLLDYAREDVRATAELYAGCEAERRRHVGVDLDLSRLASTASVAGAYLRGMRVRPPRLPDEIERAGMCAMYGGRVEAKIVHAPVPVVVLDWASMYPTTAARLGVWPLLTATPVHLADVTDELRETLAAADLAGRLLDPAEWARWGATLVEVEPEGDVLVHRARYPDGDGYGLATNPLTYDGSLWWSWPDVAAAAVLGGRAPRIVRALRPEPVRQREGLRAVRLPWDGEDGQVALLDPRADPFAALLTARRREDAAGRHGRVWKIMANAVAHGQLARFDPAPPGGAAGSVTERPGPYCTPVADAAVTAGARLLLALLERRVVDAGGAWAFCDTDSMAIVALPDGGFVPCVGGPFTSQGGPAVRALSWEQVDSIRCDFDRLALGDAGWKVEHGSCTDQARPLRALVVGTKMYALYRLGGPAAQVEIVDAKELGLRGIYVDPAGVDWVRELWETYVRSAEDGEPDWEARAAERRNGRCVEQDDIAEEKHREYGQWSRLPAVGTLTVSTPAVAASLQAVEQQADAPIRPFTFLLWASSAGGGVLSRAASVGSGRLVAPFTRDPHQWGPDHAWRESCTGRPAPEGREVKRLLDVALSHAVHEDTAFVCADPDVWLPRGLLVRRPAVASPALLAYVAKEGAQVTERVAGLLSNAEAVQVVAEPDLWETLVVPVLARMGPAEVARRAQLPLNGELTRYLDGRARPRGRRGSALHAAAVGWARERLPDAEAVSTWEDRAVFAHALAVAAAGGRDRRCDCGCGRPPAGRSRWAGEACRKQSGRAAAKATGHELARLCDCGCEEPKRPRPRYASAGCKHGRATTGTPALPLARFSVRNN